LLKSAQEIYGRNAPEKLLYHVFERKIAGLKQKVKGDNVADRAKWLTRLRDSEGHMAQFAIDEKEGGPQILECHSPIMNLLDRYPIISRNTSRTNTSITSHKSTIWKRKADGA